ncbi:MAG: hypothetical protein PHP29_02670 [Tissierellia bacterium]|nr:hypothetical protein [Tissierellia bacterium]
MKKINPLIVIIILMLLIAACTRNVQKADTGETGNNSGENQIDEAEKTDYLTGEVITDGIYGNADVYYIYFIPDKETRQLIYNDYPSKTGESIPMKFESMDIVKDLPGVLGVYDVAIEADFTADIREAELKSIKLTDDIGTVEYEGKTYETNDLDENVQPKDRVCGLIVENVRRFDDGGVIISFEGEIESEGFYNVYPGGDMFQGRIGEIIRDKESVKNFPTYKGEGNTFSVWFSETNELYDELANYSAIGRGKFKSTNYYIIYNYGMGPGPGEILTEIVSLDDKYNDLFVYNENEIGILGFSDDYLIASENIKNGLETVESTYYFVSGDEPSKIKIASSNNEFGYRFEKSNDDASKKDGSDFNLVYYNYGNSLYDEKKAHTLKFKYFNKGITGSDADLLTKDVNYGTFKNGEGTIELYEGNEFLNMAADDISVLYHCKENSPDELAWIRVKFTGQVTLTGKLSISTDAEFGYQVYFTADSESTKKLPQHVEDTRDAGGIRFTNENLKEILGQEPIDRDCEITIKNYYIHYAATEAVNTAELVSVRYGE